MATYLDNARWAAKWKEVKTTTIEKYNPNRDPSTGRFTTGSGTGGFDVRVTEGDLMKNHFERAVDKAYGTGTDSEFTIAHTGDESTAALGRYLADGHNLNDIARAYKNPDYVAIVQDSPTFRGLDNAIEMAPRMPNQTVWRTASAEAVLNLKKGAIYQDRGYTSTTVADITHPDNGVLLLTLAKVSHGKKAIMEIKTGKEGKGIYMPKMFPGQPIAEFEKEFLMPRNTKMKYMGPDYKFLDSGSILEIHKFKVVD